MPRARRPAAHREHRTPVRAATSSAASRCCARYERRCFPAATAARNRGSDGVDCCVMRRKGSPAVGLLALFAPKNFALFPHLLPFLGASSGFFLDRFISAKTPEGLSSTLFIILSSKFDRYLKQETLICFMCTCSVEFTLILPPFRFHQYRLLI